MAEVRLVNINKSFGKVVAVHDFSLDIADGEFIILVGPSGCGKSTVLRSIAGLEEITSGELYIGGALVNDVHPKNRDIAMVFQNYALYPHMNVYNNMAFSLKQNRMPREKIEQIVRHSAELLGIVELLDRKPRQLSGGQRQRVALGRAIVRDPQVFLFDEPLSNLDAKLRITMRAELLELHQNLKTTSIYVTHDQVEAMTMGDRLVVMNQGRIQQVDTPQRLYDSPANRFVAGFIGAPPMNFIDCVVARNNGDYRLNADSISLVIPKAKAARLEGYVDREVVLGLRPEHILERSATQEAQAGTTFRALVRVVEPLGSEKFVHLRIGEGAVVVRLDPGTALRAGEQAEFVARMDMAYLFDQETGQAII